MQENYYLDHDPILCRGYPFGLVVHLGIYISFAYSIWPQGGHVGFELKSLLPPFQENYLSDLHQTLHTASPYGLVVHQGIFLSHLHIQYGRHGVHL